MDERAREQHRTALRRLVAGTALAVVGTAAMVAVTLPMSAAGDEGEGTARTGVTPSASASATPADESPAPYAAPPATGSGTGADPLTDDEIDRARRAALTGDRTLRTTSENVRGKDGTPQFLTAELGEGAEDGARSADVFFYDYRDDRFVKKTVDLGTGKVVRAESATRVQPAPSGQESREALKVLLASPLGDGVRQDFEAATGQPAGDGDRLAVQGLVYERSGTAGPADCDGTHRCVRLFTRVKGGPWIDTRQFVVDLSARTAHQLP